MSEPTELALWEAGLPASPIVQLTTQFYAWERRGRGWQVWEYPVQLEPPFQPFAFHFAPAVLTATDDARKPTFLSTLLDKLRSRIRGAPLVPEPAVVAFEPDLLGPEPAVFSDSGPLIELAVSIPPTLKITREAAEQFLLSLSYSGQPLSFEVIGQAEAITVQLACRAPDRALLCEQLKAHFPEAVVNEETSVLAASWDRTATKDTAVVDFGLSYEFMRPLRTFRTFDTDPLIAVTGALGDLQAGELAVLQVLFQAARQPWAESIIRAVTDCEGKAFFADAPDMVTVANAKISRPLFAAVVRVAAQSPVPGRAWEMVRALGAVFAQFADPSSNELIPLSNDGYPESVHQEDLLARRAHRSGMLLNSKELVSLVHLPSVSVRAEKLKRELKKTKAAPAIATGHAALLGENQHAGVTTPVSLSSEQRIQHTYVIGASGAGKSTLLLNLIVQDIEQGAGVGVLDPHGDLIDQVLGYIPEERFSDVVLLDPSDAAYPVGFNILSAHSELERNLLASDMVAVFRRLSTSWGDQMTSLLGNAVLAFLESDEGGTLADLKRFLVERDFRQRFLRTVRDPEVVYYWEKEFPLLRGKPQGPVLTRLDTFLRPKLIRYMVSQKENRLDFGAIMNHGKIFLAKLAQGAIGEENAYLLGTLLVSKFHQLAQSRQEMTEAERRPFFLHIDEFHNFITPSMAAIIAGARKFRLGLTLAHQDLRQLERKDSEVLGAVMANPYTRICFRVGDLDARKLEDGFSFFDTKDLQSLGLGEAICRIERADYDFNLQTLPLPPLDPDLAHQRRERLITLSRERYATPREAVEATLQVAVEPERPEPEIPAPARPERLKVPTGRPRSPAPAGSAPQGPAARQEIPAAQHQPAPLGRGGPQHKYLQELIKRWAEGRGFRGVIEEPILDGLGSVDVALEKGEVRVACEVSITSSPDQELGNVQKCLAAGFDHVVVVAPERKTLRKTAQLVESSLDEATADRVRCSTPEELFVFLEQLDALAASREQTVRGYKVKVQYKTVGEEDKEARRSAISKVILRALKRLKGTVE